MSCTKRGRGSKAETDRENISHSRSNSVNENGFSKALHENVGELLIEEIKINEQLIAHVDTELLKAAMGSASIKPDGACPCNSQADKSNLKSQQSVFDISLVSITGVDTLIHRWQPPKGHKQLVAWTLPWFKYPVIIDLEAVALRHSSLKLLSISSALK
ncbi:hypothetical protein Aduo_019047 [Ancylostoma duodenale]